MSGNFVSKPYLLDGDLRRAVNRQPGSRAADCRGTRVTKNLQNLQESYGLQTLKTSIHGREIHPNFLEYHPDVPTMLQRHPLVNSGRIKKFEKIHEISKKNPENFPDLWFTLTPHCGFS